MNSIHGHEVMHMMLESQQQYTIDTLKDAITNKFGAEARFHTCSAKDMTAAELIECLTKKGKFVAGGSGFSTQVDKICKH